MKKHFPDEILAQIQKDKIIGIRAGRASAHKVIGIWLVVVEGRVFIRSWSMSPRAGGGLFSKIRMEP